MNMNKNSENDILREYFLHVETLHTSPDFTSEVMQKIRERAVAKPDVAGIKLFMVLALIIVVVQLVFIFILFSNQIMDVASVLMIYLRELIVNGLYHISKSVTPRAVKTFFNIVVPTVIMLAGSLSICLNVVNASNRRTGSDTCCGFQSFKKIN